AEPVWGVPAPLILIIPGALLCLPAVGGLAQLLCVRDTEYHFRGSRLQLAVRDRRGERQVIPFGGIVKAEAYSTPANDEPDTYGLRLKLRGFGRKLQMTQLDGGSNRWRCQVSDLAERINRFLEAHSGEAGESPASDEPKGVARPQPRAAVPDR